MTRIQWPTVTCFVLALFLSNTTFAKEQEVQLEVQNMTCASCYYMVNKVLLDVDGVLEVEFPYAGIAGVLYDDALCLVENLIEATTKYGYPSTVLEEDAVIEERRRPMIRGPRSIREFLDQLIQG